MGADLRLDPTIQAQMIADAEAMRILMDSPGWVRYQELLELEKTQQIAYLDSMPPDREVARLIGVRNGLQKAISIPETVIEMARQAIRKG